MGRRSSGWTVVKQVVREIDRANRRSIKASIAQEKTVARANDREQREYLRLVERIKRDANRTLEQLNKSLQMADASDSISTKQSKITETKRHLKTLKELCRSYDFISLSNTDEIENVIQEVDKEIENLIQKENQLFNKVKAAEDHTVSA